MNDPNNNKTINMVENQVLRPEERRITKENIIYECKRLELMSFFRQLDDEMKNEYLLGRADYEIIDWHLEVSENTRKATMSYMRWKILVKEKFEKKPIPLDKLYRMSQGEDETIKEFCIKAKNASKDHQMKEVEIIKIIVGGLVKGVGEISRYLLTLKSLDDEALEVIQEMEDTYKRDCKEELDKNECRKKEISAFLEKKLEELKVGAYQSRRTFKCYNCGGF